jgi:hypothetical protein
VGALEFELPAHQATDIKASCTAKYAADTHLVKTQPHMHARGVQLDRIVERANGSRETLIDAPYDFINQITYETGMVVKPGKLSGYGLSLSERHRQPFLREGSTLREEMRLTVLTAWPAGYLKQTLWTTVELAV